MARGGRRLGRLVAGGVALAALVSACAQDDANFSQYPGFAAYLEANPPAETAPDEAERALLRAYRPRFHVAEGESGPISFYGDYIPEGYLVDGSGERISADVDRALLNAHKTDPEVIFTHTGSPEGGTPVVPARINRDTLALPGSDSAVPVTFLTYNLVFRQSGIATGIPGWQRGLLHIVADPNDWHQLDHYAAVTLALVPETGAAADTSDPEALRPFAAVMQQHNYMRSYVLVPPGQARDHPGRTALPADGRLEVDVAEQSHALFPHAAERRRHRAVRFLDGETANYLIDGTNAPWLAGDDITDPARTVDYELTFLPPSDAFYMFRGWLGERRRLPGRDGPPGAFYNTPPPLQPERVQVPVFFWHEAAGGYPADFGELALDGWQPPGPDALAPFARRLVAALPCRDGDPLPCSDDLATGG